eukprot:Opistho-2@86614
MSSNEDASDTPMDGKKDGHERKGRRKINIEFIDDKSRRHITFSKRKAGIMKKAYELSTLTGTQVLLLVASETGHVYTFATPKLQPLITKPEGKNMIQSCLNAPDNPTPRPHLPHPNRVPQTTPRATLAALKRLAQTRRFTLVDRSCSRIRHTEQTCHTATSTQVPRNTSPLGPAVRREMPPQQNERCKRVVIVIVPVFCLFLCILRVRPLRFLSL